MEVAGILKMSRLSGDFWRKERISDVCGCRRKERTVLSGSGSDWDGLGSLASYLRVRPFVSSPNWGSCHLPPNVSKAASFPLRSPGVENQDSWAQVLQTAKVLSSSWKRSSFILGWLLTFFKCLQDMPDGKNGRLCTKKL